MAVGHYLFNDSTVHGRQLRSFINQLDEVFAKGNELIAVMDQMKDGGVIGQYLADRFGFGVTPGSAVTEAGVIATAQGGYAELASLMGKLNTTGVDTTDHVRDAILQAIAKFG